MSGETTAAKLAAWPEDERPGLRFAHVGELLRCLQAAD
jgi:hypothetical protein